jgi:hypothetical protein
VLDIVVHKNARLSEDIVSYILDSDHVPVIFHSLDHTRTRNVSGPVDKYTDWEQFRSLASKLILPRIQIISKEEADKAVRENTAFIPLACRLSTIKFTFSDLNKALYGQEGLLKITRRLCKLWQVNLDPVCKRGRHNSQMNNSYKDTETVGNKSRKL